VQQRIVERNLPKNGLPVSFVRCLRRREDGLAVVGSNAMRAFQRAASSSSRRISSLHDLLGLAPDTPKEEVRRSYLRAALATHPDRSEDPQAADRMVALQDAWQRYRVRTWNRPQLVGSGFTRFGVGCSFSDNAEEQQQRADLMAEAATGRLGQRALPKEGERIE